MTATELHRNHRSAVAAVGDLGGAAVVAGVEAAVVDAVASK